MIRCPSCETANADDARFCERCGAALAGPAEATQLIDPVAAAASSSGDAPGVDHEARRALLELARRELVDEYDVEREIGRGGMAVVFRAIELGLRRPVALKVLPPGLALGASVVERFKREAQMAASLDHPNIIPVYRVGQTPSLLYLTMRYVEGRSLDAVIASQGALPVPAVLSVLRSAAAALAYAHEHRIVHRDVKGANILIDTSGRVIVTDFGVARAIENASMTTTGSVIGTPYFMSPEACAGKVAGPQSDQYSLGIVAFQMLTGAVPFHAETLAAIMNHHLITPPPDITAVRDDVPPALVDVVKRMLMKDPVQRYRTTGDLLAEIEAIPLTAMDRSSGETVLRELAHGASVASIATQKLPPLADTMGIVAAHDALLRSTERATKRRRTRRVVVLAGAAVALAAYALLGTFRGSRVIPAAAASTPGATAVPSAPDSQTSPVTPPAPPPRTIVPVTVARNPRRRDSVPVPVTAAVDTTPGKMRVRALPGDATIFVDGRPVGHGAVFDVALPPGLRALRIVAPGYAEYDTTFTVRPGETTNLATVTLKGSGQEP